MSWIILVNWFFGLSDLDNYLSSPSQVKYADVTQNQVYDKQFVLFISPVNWSDIKWKIYLTW